MIAFISGLPEQFRAAKQHQAQQEVAHNHFLNSIPPTMIPAPTSGGGAPGLLPEDSNPSGVNPAGIGVGGNKELFGTQYHPSKYGRDPETLPHVTIGLQVKILELWDFSGLLGGKPLISRDS